MRTGILALVFLLLGCGGSSGTNDSATKQNPVPLRLVVAWPERTRQLAPAEAAVSVRVTLSDAGETTPAVELICERRTQSAAYASEHESAKFGVPGYYRLDAEHWTEHRSSGVMVAKTTAEVRLLADGHLADLNGNPLGPLLPEGLVDFILIQDVDRVLLGTDQVLQTFLMTQNNAQLYTMPVGAVRYRLVSGTDFAEVLPDGTVHPKVIGGPVIIEASLDGLKDQTVLYVTAPRN